MKFSAPLIAVTLLGLCALAPVSPVVAAGMNAQEFVEKASASNQFEISSSKLALEKSQNAEVKAFAQQMIEEHTQAGEKMKAAMAASNVDAKADAGLDVKHQNMMKELASVTGAKFDASYITMQDTAHQEAVALFRDYANEGSDPALRDFARKTLPTLEKHATHVQQLKTAK